MRTKTLAILAALAAGAITAQAQSNVYSVNVVGYVNKVLKGGGAFTLVGNPLNNGTNDLLSLVGGVLPNKSSVQIWNGTTFQASSKALGSWSVNLSIPPGTGFFVKNASLTDVTNTFVGNVIIGFGASNSVALPAGQFVLACSPVPFAGFLNDSGTNTINLGPSLANKSSVQVWDNSGAGTFVAASKALGNWSTNLPISVAQGFFIKSATATNWIQTLQ